MKQQKIYARFFSIFCVIITSALALFAPWADLDGTLYTLPQLLFKVTKAGGPSGFVADGNTAAFATYCITYLAAILLILYAIIRNISYCRTQNTSSLLRCLCS